MFRMEIETDDDAYRRAVDISGELEYVARQIHDALICDRFSGKLMDSNGNQIGDWEFERPMRVQEITLRVTYDPYNQSIPERWDWATLCETDVELVSSDEPTDA